MERFIPFEEMARPDLTLRRMIELACGRPEMFAGGRSFGTVATYLCGYDAAVGNLTGKGMLFTTDLTPFGHWLKRRLSAADTDRRTAHRTWFVLIEEMYPDDETRLRQLPVLFGEYLGEREQSGV